MSSKVFEPHASADRLGVLMAEQARRQQNPVIALAENMRKAIQAFETTLDAEHEIGFRIASFGGVIFFHAETIAFVNPDLVIFTGTTDDGERVQLVQHHSQLSFLLKAAKKLEPVAKRIGFL